MPDIGQFLFTASVWVIPVIVAITFHEAAHGYVAWKLGDDTAKVLGRVTFNPLRHVDPFGTVVLPAIMYFTTSFLFGWAKPVPVNFRRLRNPRYGMVLVALAGPAINIVLAFFSAWALRWVGLVPDEALLWVQQSLVIAVQINVILAVFNMIPLPPLDGGRVAVGLLPRQLAMPIARLEPYGLFILIGVLFIVPLIGTQLGYNLSVLPWLLGPPVEYVIRLLGFVTGHG
ncbi:site-2 protease family protein [Skermanella sp. TT6]|uniref:Site-2 protease family protein n=1 Tax=Skermanella cutis TaxID=2775420 RepID=A0ABX7B0J4_9PROT|nr:site-2 protease family protein [Skermanella sp. TT6]QQP87852.1 site-2 protease family protein [Skermanella sp. TT6]